MRSTLAMGLLLLTGADAFADREGRARALFTERCASCHTVGQGAPLPPLKHKVDLTLIARVMAPKTQPGHDGRQRDERSTSASATTTKAPPAIDPLREFIKDPAKANHDTRCGANNLDEVQVELLVGLLRRRALPPQPPAQIPPAQFRPPLLDEKRLPSGPGDHR